jgi:predicted ATP-grasp superfamily ATP-dependent carboligase
MSERKKKCILTYASSWSSLAAARCLGAAGIEIIAGDHNILATGCFSKYSKHCFMYQNPETHQQEYLEKLIEVAKKHGGKDVDLVIMPMHTDCFVIAAHQKLFDGIAKLALPTFEQVKLAGNKAMLAKFCEQHDIKIPKTWQPKSLEDFEANIDKFKFPAFIKPQESNASIGLKKVANSREAREFFNHSLKEDNPAPEDYPLIQEAVEGEDFCSTFIFNHGKRKASMTYHNILDFPPKSGMGVLRENVNAEEMENIAAKVLALMNWHGVAEVDFRWDGKSTPYLIEINPRFWGGLGQSIAAGWDYPTMLFHLAIDGDIPEMKPRPKDIKTFNPCLVFLLLVEEFMEAKHPIKEIEAAFHTLKHNFKRHHIHSVSKFVKQLGKAVNPLDRFKAVKSITRQTRGSVNEMFNWKDPLPVLGLLYPIAVFLKNGKISSKILVSESKIKKLDFEDK